MGKWSQHWYLKRQNKFFMGFKHWTNWELPTEFTKPVCYANFILNLLAILSYIFLRDVNYLNITRLLIFKCYNFQRDSFYDRGSRMSFRFCLSLYPTPAYHFQPRVRSNEGCVLQSLVESQLFSR